VTEPASPQERDRRWRLVLGTDEQSLGERDRRMSSALTALYGAGDDPDGGDARKGRGGLGRSAPNVTRWLGDIREFFPAPVVQLVQKDAFDRLGLRQMLTEPEFLAAVEADVNLVADLISLRGVIPEKSKETARQVVGKVVAKLMERLERRTAEALRGAQNRTRRTRRPRHADIDWPRTIQINLSTYQPDLKTIIPERLAGFMRQQRRIVDLDEVILCVDQSGSMGTSVVYSSIFAAVMASLPVVKTKLICFDTAILDLTDELSDPIEVLFGVQLGGGTDINQAVAYCESKIDRPSKAHFILISDLYEGGLSDEFVSRVARMIAMGVNVIVLLALTDQGRPAYDANMGARLAALGAPVFACTPDQFPSLMAAALRREDIHAWAAAEDIKLLRASEPP
jgi:Mg-chelatase subunit ChlD